MELSVYYRLLENHDEDDVFPFSTMPPWRVSSAETGCKLELVEAEAN